MRFFFRWCPGVCFVLIFVLIAPLVTAVSPDKKEKNLPDQPEKETPAELETLQVTAGLRPEPALNVAAAVTVINHEDVFTRSNVLLPDLLRNEAGIFVQQTTPGQGIPIIRGLKGSQNLHLVDGIRLNTAFFRDAPNQYLALVDPFWANRIEVVRGPSSVLYGGDAMGGVVNIITHKPAFSGHRHFSGESFLAWNSASQLFQAHTRVDLNAPRHALSLSASYLRSGFRRTGGGRRIPFTDFSSRAAAGTWLAQAGENRHAGFQWQFLQQPATPRVDALVPGFSQTNPDASEYLFSPNQRDFFHAFFEDNQANHWFDSARYQLAWQKITDARQVKKWQSERLTQENNQSRSVNAKASWDRQLNSRSHLLWGMDFWHDRINSYKIITGGDGEEAANSRFPNNSFMQSGAVFAELRHSWRAYRINAGIRHSRYQTQLNIPLAPDPVKLSDWTGHLGWLWEQNPHSRWFANLGRGFRPPNIFDMGQLGDRPGNRFNILSPDLRPESLWSIDAGWKHDSPHWRWQAAVFFTRYQDKIASVFTGDYTESGQAVIQSQNLGEVKLHGVEIEMDWTGITGQEIWVRLNYVRGEETIQGQIAPADRIPPLNGTLGASWPVNAHWRIESQLRFAAAQRRLSARDVRDARIDPSGTGGFTVLDFFLAWSAGSQHSVRLGLENVFDKRYREHASGVDALGRNFSLSWHTLF